MRQDYGQFQALNSEVLVLVPHGPRLIAPHVAMHGTPYPILSDKGARVAEGYGILTLGAGLLPSLAVLKPAVFLVDRECRIRYAHYAQGYTEEPENREPLSMLAALQRN